MTYICCNYKVQSKRSFSPEQKKQTGVKTCSYRTSGKSNIWKLALIKVPEEEREEQ